MVPPSGPLPNELYRSVLDNLTEGIHLIDRNWRFVYVNRTGTRHSRRSVVELTGHTVMECFPGIEQNPLFPVLEHTMKDRTSQVLGDGVPHPDGGPGLFALRLEPVPEGLLVLSVDITDRKQAEMELLKSEERFIIAFHASPTGIAISRLRDGMFIEVNEEACRLYGYARDKVIGKTSIELGIIDEETRGRLVQDITQHSRLRAVDLVLHAGTGELRDVLFSWDTIEFDGEQCVIATILDVTELKRLEQENLRLQRMESVGALAGGIVHDMNNILSPIMLALGRLRKKHSDPDDQKMLEMLETNSRRAANLVKQILTFARGSEAKRSPLSLHGLIGEIVKLLRQTFPANISIIPQLPTVKWTISGDGTQVHQILMNLAINARDAMPNGGTLTFALENLTIDESHARMYTGMTPGLYVLLSVKDTGAGMTDDVRARIFDPFYTTKEIGKGTGLGLATVLSIVKAHGGIIDVKSEAGKGTEFRIYFPAVVQAEQEETRQREMEVLRGHGETVLVVDDDAIVREVTKISLESGGYIPLTAQDATDAIGLYYAHEDRIKLIITDMDMPDLDGASLVKMLRAKNATMRIIGSSGTANSERLKAFESSGIDAFLSKPYTSDIMLKLIYETLNPKE